MAGRLLQQPWSSRNVDSRYCLMKGVFGQLDEGEGYEIMLWDGKEGGMWHERLVPDEVTDRMALLNANVEAPGELVIAHLSSLFQSSSTTFVQSNNEMRDRKTLIINESMSGLPFTWKFYCNKSPEHEIQRHLVQPLLSCLSILNHQQHSLIDTIRRKDKEIQDYRDGGAILSRRYLQTSYFDEEDFTASASQNIKLSVDNFADVLLEPDIQRLYRNIGATACQVTDDLQNDTEAIPDSTQESETSHNKEQPAVDQDEELGRRQALERKLDEERVRGKKKRKRLM